LQFLFDPKLKEVALTKAEDYVLTSKSHELYKAIMTGSIEEVSEAVKEINALARRAGLESASINDYYADKSICKKCKRFQNINELVDELVVEDGTIYFVYNDLKKLSRLLKDPYDGMAIDIVQKEQFPCGSSNKINYMVPYKGLFQKPVYWSTMLKKNEIKDPKENAIKVAMGDFPEDIKGDYEINIVVLIDKYACRNLYRNYVEKPKEHSYTYDIMLLKDPKNNNSVPISSKDIDAQYKKQMCYRSSNSAFKNTQNFFNCTFCKLRMPEKFTSAGSCLSAKISYFFFPFSFLLSFPFPLLLSFPRFQAPLSPRFLPLSQELLQVSQFQSSQACPQFFSHPLHTREAAACQAKLSHNTFSLILQASRAGQTMCSCFP